MIKLNTGFPGSGMSCCDTPLALPPAASPVEQGVFLVTNSADPAAAGVTKRGLTMKVPSCFRSPALRKAYLLGVEHARSGVKPIDYKGDINERLAYICGGMDAV